MTSMWLEDLDIEAAEYDDSEGGESYDDSESDFDSEDLDQESRASSARRRREHQRRVALARRRQAQAKARARGGARKVPSPARPPAQRETVTAIRNLDLETKVQEDTFRRAIAAQGKRMSRSEYAAVLGAATNQFIESFQAPSNAFAKAALRFAPLLLLSPQKSGTGFEAVIKDPRVIGAAAVGGITFLGENRNRFTNASKIDVLATNELAVGEPARFVADVLDGRGNPLDRTVTWESDKTAVAEINSTGEVTTKGPGTAIITARFDGLQRKHVLRVKAAPAAADLTNASTINVLATNELAVGEKDRFLGDVLDGRGNLLDKDVTWTSDDKAVATIDPINGDVDAHKAGTAIITASFDSIQRRFRLRVKPVAVAVQAANPAPPDEPTAETTTPKKTTPTKTAAARGSK